MRLLKMWILSRCYRLLNYTQLMVTQHTTQAHRQQKHTNNTQTTQTHEQHTHTNKRLLFSFQGTTMINEF